MECLVILHRGKIRHFRWCLPCFWKIFKNIYKQEKNLKKILIKRIFIFTMFLSNITNLWVLLWSHEVFLRSYPNQPFFYAPAKRPLTKTTTINYQLWLLFISGIITSNDILYYYDFQWLSRFCWFNAIKSVDYLDIAPFSRMKSFSVWLTGSVFGGDKFASRGRHCPCRLLSRS